MILFNTTYTMPNSDARNFVIWAHEVCLPKAQADGRLSKGRVLRVLSHHDQESECFCMQFEVEDNMQLHQWYVHQGALLEQELKRLFDGRVLGFSTLMESVEI